MLTFLFTCIRIDLNFCRKTGFLQHFGSVVTHTLKDVLNGQCHCDAVRDAFTMCGENLPRMAPSPICLEWRQVLS